MAIPKVIFVGGTVRSGTSLVNVILSNQDKAMALGEIHGLISPVMKKHVVLIDELKSHPEWSKIAAGGKANLYKNLFRFFPDIEVFIDSSKDPLWINYHTKRLNNIADVANILIYKKVDSLLESFQKRGNETFLARTYENYHKKYFKLVKKPVVISYESLIRGDETCKNAFARLGLSFSKERLRVTKEIKPNFFGSQRLQSNLKVDQFQLENIKEVDEQSIEGIKLKLKEENRYEVLKLIERYLESQCYNTGQQKNMPTYSNFEILLIKWRDKLMNFYWGLSPR
ncbi:MAG: hypothetical protein ACPGVC_02270 [Salibacteraceae bacterium]